MTRTERAARWEAEQQRDAELLADELAINELGWDAYRALRDHEEN